MNYYKSYLRKCYKIKKIDPHSLKVKSAILIFFNFTCIFIRVLANNPAKRNINSPNKVSFSLPRNKVNCQSFRCVQSNN